MFLVTVIWWVKLCSSQLIFSLGPPQPWGLCRSPLLLLKYRAVVGIKRTYTKGPLSGLLLPVPLSLQWVTVDQCLRMRPPALATGSNQFPGGSLLFLWVLVHARFCLCPPSVESVLVLWKSCNQIPLGLQSQIPWSLPVPLLLVPRLRSLMWGLESSQQWKNIFGIIVFQFAGHPPGDTGLILSLLCPCYHLTMGYHV